MIVNCEELVGSISDWHRVLHIWCWNPSSTAVRIPIRNCEDGLVEHLAEPTM